MYGTGDNIQPDARTDLLGIMKNLFKFLPSALVFALCTGRLFANGFMLADQDAFAAARGDAFVATADNPSAIYYNPAGITQVSSNDLQGGIYGIYLHQSYRPAGSDNTYYNSKRLAAVPQGFYTHSFSKVPLTAGLGVYAPYGGSVNWPSDTGFRPIAISATLEYLTINPTLAWKILPSLSIGGGVMANYVDLKTYQGYPAHVPGGQNNYFYFKGSGWSAGYDAGVRWQPIKQLAFGVNFRSASQVSLDGQTHFEFLPLQNHAYSSASMSMTFPWTVVAGVSYRPTSKWNLEFDANYTDWATLGTFDLRQPNHGSLVPANMLVNYDWQPSWIFEAGATRYFKKGWHASAGYAFDENSEPNEYYTPYAADLDRHFFSVGVGRNGKRFDFDITYQLGLGIPHDVTASQPSLQIEKGITASASGTYGFISNAVMLTAGVHF